MKILFLSALATFTTLTCLAQNDSIPGRRKFELSVLGGVNFMQLDHSYTGRSADNSGYTGGLGMQYNVNPFFAIKTGGWYENKVWNTNLFLNTYRFLTVPLLAKCYIGRKPVFFIQMGPSISFLLSHEQSLVFPGYYYYTSGFDPRAPMLGIGGGFGLDIPMGKHLSASLEGNYFYRKASENYYSNVRMYSTTILFGVNYRIGKNLPVVKFKEADTTHFKRRKVFVKVYYAPGVGYRIASGGSRTHFQLYNTGNSYSYCDYESANELPAYSFETGLQLEIIVSPHVNINLGATYEKSGLMTKECEMHFSGWGDINGTFDGTSTDQVEFEFEYLSAPLIFNYYNKNKKGRMIYFGSGLETKFLTSYRGTFKSGRYIESSIDNDNDPQKSGQVPDLFLVTDAGISFPLGKTVSIFAEPTLKCQLGDTKLGDHGADIQLMSAGCKLGLKF